MVNVVLVDDFDNEVGLKDKVEAHTGDGDYHRAITILIFNRKNETLIAQRSAGKMLWPLFWDNTCASHPLPGEGYVEAGERRLTQELGFTCPLAVVDRFSYKEKYGDIGTEHELCTTLIGNFDDDIYPVADEVADYKWVSIAELRADMTRNPDSYTIWFKIALDRLIDNGTINQED